MDSDLVSRAVEWRPHLHKNPELAFGEHETSRLVGQLLAEWGLSVRTGYGRTGLVGTMTRGSSSRSLAIRADMDALPIVEETGRSYTSRRPGVMHACGHDGHVAMLLAAAKACSEMDDLDGTVHFIFQPAEEIAEGAAEMLKDGLFRDLATDSVFALHNWPPLSPGQCVAGEGPIMAAAKSFQILITGRGGHAAMPHDTIDPVPAASAVVSALHTVVGRNISPLESAVITIAEIRVGEASNVISGECLVRGTIRFLTDSVGETAIRRLEQIARQVSAAFECTAKVDIHRGVPATVNDVGCSERVRKLISDSVPSLSLCDMAPSMAGEDFGSMLEAKPGCFVWLGGARDGENPGLHSPRFDFNDAILPHGAELWVALVQQTLKRS